jgi:transcriptional regulator with XRE-family HTH domain
MFDQAGADHPETRSAADQLKDPRRRSPVMADKNYDPLNVLVGRNIKLQRMKIGLAQTELAKRTKITLHHLQQCEIGAHRTEGELLSKIAAVLQIPVGAFFSSSCNPDHKALQASPIAMLAEPFAMRMLRAYCDISDMELRRALVDLAERFTARLQPSSNPIPATESVASRPLAGSRLSSKSFGPA